MVNNTVAATAMTEGLCGGSFGVFALLRGGTPLCLVCVFAVAMACGLIIKTNMFLARAAFNLPGPGRRRDEGQHAL